jgi:hypothetical protein
MKRLVVFVSAILVASSARAADPLERCTKPILVGPEEPLLLRGAGGFRIDASDRRNLRFFVTLRSQTWARFLPDEWEIPRESAWEPVPVGNHTLRIVGQVGGRYFYVCVDSPEYSEVKPTSGGVMFPLYASVRVGEEDLSADVAGERVRLSRGRAGSRKWLLVREVAVGDAFEIGGVRVRLVRIVPDAGMGWMELGRAR